MDRLDNSAFLRDWHLKLNDIFYKRICIKIEQLKFHVSKMSCQAEITRIEKDIDRLIKRFKEV